MYMQKEKKHALLCVFFLYDLKFIHGCVPYGLLLSDFAGGRADGLSE